MLERNRISKHATTSTYIIKLEQSEYSRLRASRHRVFKLRTRRRRRSQISTATTQCAWGAGLARCYRYTAWRLCSEDEIVRAIEAESTEAIIWGVGRSPVVAKASAFRRRLQQD